MKLLEEGEEEDKILSDSFRDIHCFCDTIACVALSFYEAQTSINPDLQVGFSVKIGGKVFILKRRSPKSCKPASFPAQKLLNNLKQSIHNAEL